MFKKNIISFNIEKKIAKFTLNTKYPFSKLTNDDLKYLKKYNLNDDLIISLKNAYIKNGIIIRHSHLKINMSLIAEEYSKSNVLYLSKKYDATPINIIRITFKYRGMDNTKIRYLFNNPNEMNEYDRNQFLVAKQYDIYGLVDENKQLNKSLLFEKKIEKILILNNIKFKTQEELVKEQQKEGKIHSTPDFLIKSNLIIDGKNINWIDAKNFYGAYTPFIKQSIKKQTEKYLKNYGPGCIVFNYGFSSKLNFNNISIYNI